MRIIILLILCALVSCIPLNGQEYQWWNDLVDWDGHTPWQNYLTLSSKYLGPNALPVPDFNSSGIHTKGFIQTEFVNHFSRKEKSFNPLVMLAIPLGKRVSIESWMVPFERYEMTIETRNERKVRDEDGKGWVVGDVYFSTQILIMEEKDGKPMILGRASLKTASGGKLSAGRFTDTPGYYFDIGFAKSIFREQFEIRPFFLGGLYVYQTYHPKLFQNDAFLFTVGSQFNFKKLNTEFSIPGYIGYMANGDQPVLFRTKIDYIVNKNLNLILRSHLGLHDYPYWSLGLGIKYMLEIKNGE